MHIQYLKKCAGARSFLQEELTPDDYTVKLGAETRDADLSVNLLVNMKYFSPKLDVKMSTRHEECVQYYKACSESL